MVLGFLLFFWFLFVVLLGFFLVLFLVVFVLGFFFVILMVGCLFCCFFFPVEFIYLPKKSFPIPDKL